MTSTEWTLGVADMIYRAKIRGKRSPDAKPGTPRTALTTAILLILDDGNEWTIRDILHEAERRGIIVKQYGDVRDRIKYLARKGRLVSRAAGRANTYHLQSARAAKDWRLKNMSGAIG